MRLAQTENCKTSCLTPVTFPTNYLIYLWTQRCVLINLLCTFQRTVHIFGHNVHWLLYWTDWHMNRVTSHLSGKVGKQ